MSKVLVLHGPNLNLLGTREPEVYGHETLADINASLEAIAGEHNVSISFMQTNAEHELIEAIHAARGDSDYIIINPGAFTHTSIALRDAFLSVSVPFLEVHLSNVFSREEFRQLSYLSDVAVGVISGLGSDSYRLALRFVIGKLEA